MTDIKNTKLEKFVKVTLRGKTDDFFTLPGKQIVKLILRIMEEERKIAVEEIREIIKSEFDKAEYNSEMAQWKGANIEEVLFEEIKRKVTFRVLERLKRFK